MGISDEIDVVTIAIDKTTIREIKATDAIQFLSILTTSRAMTRNKADKKSTACSDFCFALIY